MTLPRRVTIASFRYWLLFMNLLSGAIAAIWLLILGQWFPLLVAGVTLAVSPFILGMVFLITGPFFALAERNIERRILHYATFWLTLSSIVELSVLISWSFFVHSVFLNHPLEAERIPMLLLAWNVAIFPISRMASYDDPEDDYVPSTYSHIWNIHMQLGWGLAIAIAALTSISEFGFLSILSIVLAIAIIVRFIAIPRTLISIAVHLSMKQMATAERKAF